MNVTADRGTRRTTSFEIASWTEWLLFTCMALGAFVAIVVGFRVAMFPYQIDYSEGTVLEGALRVKQNEPLYPAPDGLPVAIHVYGPIGYAVVSLAIPAHGASFLAGRVLMLVCVLTLALLIAGFLSHWKCSRPVALAFGLMLLTLPAFRFWLYLLRVDLIGIVLSVAGLFLYTVKPRYVLWTVPFFTAALFCKYSLWAAPAAILLHLTLAKQYKAAGRFAGLLVVLCGTIFCWLQARSGAFEFHMLATYSDTYSMAQFLGLMGLVWLSAPVVTGMALFQLKKSIASSDTQLASLYFLTSGIASLTAGKVGSTTNHFLEWMVASCLCAGAAYTTIKEEHPRRLLPVTVALAISVLLGTAVQGRALLKSDGELTECGDAYNYVGRSRSSRILSQSLGPLLLAGKPIVLTDPFAYGQLVKRGVLSDGDLVSAVNERYFDLIITTVDPEKMQPNEVSIWPRSLLDAMARRYHAVQRFNCRDGSVMLEPRR